MKSFARPTGALRPLATLLTIALFAGCSGGNHLLPAVPGASTPQATTARHKKISVRVAIRIPHRRPGDARELHPATISSLTQSVDIAVNGGAAQLFNTTPSSPGCSIGAGGTTCTFSVNAAVGNDSFAVTTYSATGGTGTPLDRGIATIAIAAGKANSVAVSLGPVVSTAADSGVGSLRYAVATANAGDTIMFLPSVGNEIPLVTGITLTRTVTIAGPGAASLTISGEGTHQVFLITGTATISGLTLTGGDATIAPGGAIYNAGSLTLASDQIGSSQSNATTRRVRREDAFAARLHPHCSTTYDLGGGVYNNGTLISSATTYTGNTVPSNSTNCIIGRGGAIYNDITGTIASTGDTFSNNAAAEGGAVYNEGFGAANFTSDTFENNTGCTAATGCPEVNCTSSGCTSSAAGAGAAIFDAGAGVTIASSTFTSNVAGGAVPGSVGEGGALLLTTGFPSVTGSTFSGNIAGGGTSSCSTGTGGAIGIEVPVALNNDTFTNNVASGDSMGGGGAVAGVATTAALSGTNDTFTGNKAIGLGSSCAANGQGVGGAVYTYSVSLTNSTFSSNAASGAQGSAGGALGADEATLSGDTFTSNTATATGAFSAVSVNAGGGAMFTQTSSRISNCTFTSNSASAAGPNVQQVYGGAVIGATGMLFINNNTFTSNSTTVPGTVGEAVGGAVAMVNGEFTSSNDAFKSNTATGFGAAAGALFLDASYIVNNDTFDANAVSGADVGAGGALGTAGGGELLHDAFAGNIAAANTDGAGGALFDQGGATIVNGDFAGNEASTEGGAIATGDAETISDTAIAGNTVTTASVSAGGGGGVFSSSTLNVEESVVSGNAVTVSGSGGGGGGIFNTGTLNLDSTTVSGNSVLGSAATAGGGGLLLIGNVALVNATISNNLSKIDGGGILLAGSGTNTFSNVTLFQNSATSLGGNFLNLATTTITNSIVGGGSAATGADIDNSGTLTSGDYNIIQTPVAGTAISGTTTHNHQADPLLSALADNGGPAFTNADGASSPGRGLIPFSGNNCGTLNVPYDERGYARGAGGVCDAGAFEYAGVATAIRHRAPLGHGGGHPGPLLVHLPKLHVRIPKLAF